MELHFTRTNGPVDEMIDRLIAMTGGIHHPDIVREMVLAALKAGTEEREKADMKLMNNTLKEMRFTSKVFGPYNKVRKVTVFGSARTHPEEPIYEIARHLGEKLAGSGYMVITGAGGGIMQAVNEGAGPENSFGVNILLPHEQQPNPVLIGNPRLITYKYFFNRKVAFIKEADAVVLFPGGFGTLDEAMETLTLLQNGKRNPLPLILVDAPEGDYWQKWIRFFRDELLCDGYISESDFDLFESLNSVDAAVESIKRFFRRYHSVRNFEDKLIMRVSAPLDEHHVKALKEGFGDILTKNGNIILSGPLPAEADEPELAHLQRVVIDFNRRDFGRLRKLIDLLNSF